MGAAAIDQLSSLLEADHQFLRKYLAENNCTDEFLPELHSSGVLDMMPELLKVIQTRGLSWAKLSLGWECA